MNLQQVALDGVTPSNPNLKSLSSKRLVEHIVSQHHGFLRNTLPALSHRLDRLVAVYGSRHPELAKSRAIFHRFANDMNEHMEKEEDFLFPLICKLEEPGGSISDGSLGRIIEVVESEHVNSKRDLSEIRRLLRDYVPPEGVCGTYRALLQGLTDIEVDTHQHLHAENRILFPRARQQA